MNVNNQVVFDNFSYNHKKLYGEINKTNTQISTGKKIQHSYEDSTVFTQSLRLDEEVQNLEEVEDRTSESKIIADSTDSVLNDFDESLRTFKTKLLTAANPTMNSDNYEALAAELEKEKDHMLNLANTQINGVYIFSGTNTNIPTMDQNGNYQGNSTPLTTTISKDVKVPYTLSGKELFLGDSNLNKVISTNVKLINQNTDKTITTTDKIDDLIKDSDGSQINFFISGIRHDGSSFREKVAYDSNSTMQDLLDTIGEKFGNTNDTKLVNVTLDENGSINIEDLQNGKSALSLTMSAFQGGNSDDETDLTQVTYDKKIELVQSNFDSPLNVEEDLQTNSFYFKKNGAILNSNVPLLSGEEYATNKSKLSEMANGSLHERIFKMSITNVKGEEKEINLNLEDESTFEIDGNTYNIYNFDGTKTKDNDMTLGQLNNVISMVVADELPQTNDFDSFNNAIKASRQKVDVSLDSGNRLQIKDKTNTNDGSKIEFSLYDSFTNDFDPSIKDFATLNFMSNNLVTTQKPENDFFKDLDEIIQSVRVGKVNTNSSSENPRLIGIQNSINTIDKFSAHFSKEQSKIGSLSKTLEVENQKATTLKTNVKTLKSEVEDIDMAETIVKLNQLTLNFQAMLSTISQVNSLSLLNYLK